MKKYFEGATSLEELRDTVLNIKKKDDKRTLYTFIAIVTAILIATIIAVVCILKKRMDDDYDEDWDCDWEDCDEDCFGDEDCCCTDKDVDNSVKVEKI